MMTSTNIQSKFSLGPLIPLPGLEGERLVVTNSHVAVISSAEVRWQHGSEIKKLNLPQIQTKHARWIKNGNGIGAGVGKINLGEGRWESFPMLSQLDQYAPHGVKHTVISSISWSEDGKHAVVVLKTIEDSGSIAEQRQIYLFDAIQNNWLFNISRLEIDEAIIVGDHVLLLSENITILNFFGKEVTTMPASKTRPYRVSWDLEFRRIAILDHDWLIRIIDLDQWKVKAEWKGMFKDVSIRRDHIIALDVENHLHAACLQNQTHVVTAEVETGLLINQIAIGDDEQIFLMGSGPVAVHKSRYSISCTE